MDKAALIAKYGAETQDSAALNVRYTVEDGNIMIEGKRWLPPKEWDRQPNDDYAKTVTFTDGNDFDFFMVGEWNGDAVISDSDYALDSGFYNYLNKREDYVFAISSVGGPYSVIPHFEIMGK